MANLSDMQLILTGAITEAIRARHASIDVDHLLMGLVSAGGPSAALLAGQGVGLAELRTAARELERDDLIAAGVEPPAPLPDRDLTPTQTYELLRRGDWDFAPEAKQLAKAITVGPLDDREVLAAALEDPRAAEFLGRAGAAPEVLRAALAMGDLALPDQDRPRGEIAVERLITAPMHQVWPLLADPAARLTWDQTLSDTVVTEDGTLEQTVRGAGRRAVVPHRLTSVDPPADGRARVTWQETYGAGGSELDLELTEVEGGTRIRLVRRLSEPRNLLQRVSRLWSVPFLRGGLGMMAQELNQAVADAQTRS